MQSTGQTSTQAVSFVPMHGSVMMNGISPSLHKIRALCIPMTDERVTAETPTDEEKRANLLRLVFDGSEERLQEFLRVIRQEIPEGTGVVLRGSAITGRRWKDGAPFDADGPGTSDLDVTLVGDAPIGLFTVTGFFVPGMHSRPLSDDDPGIAPALIPLRETLMAMTGRPVNIQASRELVMQFRGDLLGQPYLVLIPAEGRF
jgi:hypothetical protein